MKRGQLDVGAANLASPSESKPRPFSSTLQAEPHVNDNPPKFTSPHYAASISEDIPALTSL
ncbi:unnamed protein product [Caenorhabditis auriculariae]|uniref:Uncharacterized protein n=1 Tax=Caenorhabditis auriculariae TaxID=2777116 RepID=A0A8S1HCY3_9PELO|nr:unnamed protein product [Caenorhabditis auriculariae]